MKPDASVIIPTYNRRQLLQRTLMSLADQTYPAGRFEVIVVDDGSTDGTEDMVQALNVPYPLHYVRQPNQGRAVARNTAASTVTATIDQQSDVTASGAATVQALDTSDATADVVSVAISGGLAGLSVGVGIAENDIRNVVMASVLDSATQTGGADDLKIFASSNQAIDANATVVSISLKP